MSTDILPYLYLRFLLFLLLIALFSLLCYPRDKFQKFKCSIRFHYSVPCRMFSLNFNILKQENKIKERIVMIFFNITFLPFLILQGLVPVRFVGIFPNIFRYWAIISFSKLKGRILNWLHVSFNFTLFQGRKSAWEKVLCLSVVTRLNRFLWNSDKLCLRTLVSQK